MRFTFAAIAPLVLMAGCSSSEEEPAQPRDDAVSAENSVSASSDPDTTTSAAPAAVPDYGLTRGVYSSDSCPPALASVTTFDGAGFNTRNTVDCTFTPNSQDGAIYAGEQSCLDSYSKEELVERITIEVLDVARFVRTDAANGSRAYRLCPEEDLADWTAQPSAPSSADSASRKAL